MNNEARWLSYVLLAAIFLCSSVQAAVDLGLNVPATSTTGDYTVTWDCCEEIELQELQGGTFYGIYIGRAAQKSFTNKPEGTYTYRAGIEYCFLNCRWHYTDPQSISVSLTPSPIGPISGPSSDTNGAYTLSWGSSSAATSYTLQRRLNGGSWATIQNTLSTSRPESGLTNGTYGYRVKACNPAGCTSYSPTKIVIVLFPPSVPGGLSAPSTDEGTYTVSWNSVLTANRYLLQRQTNGGSWSTIQNTSATSRLESGRDSGVYSYKVRACNSSGCSAYSSAVTVAVGQAVPGGTIDLGLDVPATSDTGNYTVSWDCCDEIELQELQGGTFYGIYIGTAAQKSFTNKPEGTYTYRVGIEYCFVNCNWHYTEPQSIVVSLPDPPTHLMSPANSATGFYLIAWDAGPESASDVLQERKDGGVWTDIYWAGGNAAVVSGRTSGEYEYRVSRTFDMPHPDPDFSAYSHYSSTTVTIPPPVATVGSTTPGNIPHESGVTKRGDAYINIPIAAAPGVNGLQPQLALAYNSSRRRERTDRELPGDTLGYGWSVAGLSEIRRCVTGQDNANKVENDTSDYACLDGEPLVLVGGTYWSPGSEYRARRESYIKITLQGTTQNPWFEAKLPNGDIIEYGNTDDSRVHAIDYVVNQGVMTETVTGPVTWSITRRMDAFGNEMLFTYYKDELSGINVPATIAYGLEDGNGYDAVVAFEYLDRTDHDTIALGETTLDRLLLLQKIEISLDGVPIREYLMESEQSAQGWYRLDKVQLCGYDTSGAVRDCLAAMDIDWQEPSETTNNQKTFVSQLTDSNGAVTKFSYGIIPVTGSASFLIGGADTPFGNEPGTLPAGTEMTPVVGENYGSVVTQVQRSNGLGGWHTTSYAYQGKGLQSTKNWGFLGFYATRITDEQSGVVTYNQYRLDFPHFADLVQTYQYDGLYTGSNQLLSKRIIERTSATIENGTYDDTVLPYIGKVTNFIIEDGTILGATEASRTPQFDSSDLIVGWTAETRFADTVSTSSSGGTVWGDAPTFSLSGIRRTIENDLTVDNATSSSSWLIGFPSETVTRYFPGAATGNADMTQRITATRYTGTNRIGTQDVFPDSGDADIHLDITNGYDSYGNLTSVTAYNANIGTRDSVSTFPTGAARYPESVTNALGHQTDVDFDARFGAVSGITDPNGRSTSIVYDEFGREISRTTPDNLQVTTNYYLCQGSCPSVGGVNPVMRVRVSSPISPTSTRYFDELGRLIRTDLEAFSGSTTIRKDIVYDSQGRIKKISNPYLVTAAAVWTEYDYDVRNRVERVDRPDNGYTTIDYAGSNGEVKQTITDKVYASDGTTIADTQVKLNYYNVLGQLRQTVDASGSADAVQTDYTYYASGLLHTTKVDNNSSTVTTMEYDNAGNRTKITGPDFGNVVSTYSAAGELKTQTDEKGNVLEWGYDVLGRVEWLKENSAQTATWTYDPTNAIGALYQRKYNSTEFVETRRYNTNARLTSVATAINVAGFSTKTFTHSYAYLSDGRIDTMTYPSGITVDYGYNSQGYLSTLTDTSTITALVTYNAADAFGVTQETYGNGIVTNRVFDAASGRLTSIVTTLGSTEIQDNSYAWQTNGILQSRHWGDGSNNLTEEFGYDVLNRLKDADTLSGTTPIRALDYTYDALGNLRSKTSSVSADIDVTNYGYGTTTNAGPHAVSSAIIEGLGITVDYDPNGNVTVIDAPTGDGKFFVWNPRNLPTKVVVGSSVNDTTPTAADEIAYGPDGERYYKKSTWDDNGTLKTEHTFYAGTFEELVTDSSDTTLDAVQKSRIGDSVLHVKEIPDTGSPTTSIEYLHRDHLGSVERVTDENGNELQVLAYDPFGGRKKDDWSGELTPGEKDSLADAGRTRGFTGHEHLDRTGIIHMNGRIFEPTLGRFLSPDPFVQFPAFGQSWSRYSYVSNAPTSFTDGTGFMQHAEPIEVVTVVGTSSGQTYWFDFGMLPYDRFARGGSGGYSADAQSRPDEAEGGEIDVDSPRGENDEMQDEQSSPESIEEIVVVGQRSDAGVNWWYWGGMGANFAGLTSSYLLHSTTFDGMWKGRNGKWNSLDWGGNRHTGARSKALRAAKRFKAGGYGLFVIGTALSGLDFYSSFQDHDGFGMAHAGMDTVWGGIATFGGLAGLAGGVSYFGTSLALDQFPNVRERVVGPIVDGACYFSGC